MNAKNQYIRKSSQGGYFAFPSDYRRPPHLRPVHSVILTVVSAILMILSFYSAIFLYFAFLPLLCAVFARKDAGVFWYGFTAGAALAIYTFFPLGMAVISMTIISGLFMGGWLWISRKVHHYLAFPDSSTSLAGAARKRFILPWHKQFIFCLACASLFSGLFYLFTATGLLLPSMKELPLLSEFTGSGGTYFCAILISTAVASSIEYKKINPAEKIPKEAFAISLALCGVLVTAASINSAKPQELEIEFEAIRMSQYYAPRQVLFVNRIPFQKVWENFNSPTPAGPNPVNTAGSCGVLLDADPYFSEAVFDVIRDGAKYLTVKSSFPHVKNALQKRCSEWGVSAVLISGDHKYLINSSGNIELADGINIDYQKTFYSRHPHWFRALIAVCSLITVLLMAVHSYNRRLKLYSSITGKTARA